MKRISIILLALAMTVAFAVPAMAIHIGPEGTSAGTLGITGKYDIDGEIIDEDGEGKNEFFDDDFELVMRYQTGPVRAVIDWEISDRNPLEGHSAGKNGDKLIDNYWIEWDATDAVMFKVGEYSVSFGRAIAAYNIGGSNLELRYSLDAVDFAGILGKRVDATTGAVPDIEDADETDYILRANVKNAGPFTKLDFFYAMRVWEEGLGDVDANVFALDFALPLGPVGLAGEFGTLGGDTPVDVADGSYYLLEIGLADLVGFDLGVNYYQAGDDYTGGLFGDDYAPFGVWLDNYNGDGIDTTSVWVEAGYSVNDRLSLSAAGLVMAENDAGDDQGTEVDVGLTYKFADNVTYYAQYSNFSEGDAITGFADRSELWHRLRFRF